MAQANLAQQPLIFTPQRARVSLSLSLGIYSGTLHLFRHFASVPSKQPFVDK